MTTPQEDDLNQLLLDIAVSTARLRAMADEAHALVERLERRQSTTRVNLRVAVEKTPSATRLERRPPCF